MYPSKIHGILAVEVELVQVELGRPKAICREGQVHWCRLKKTGVIGDAGSGVIGASMSVWGHTLGELTLNLDCICLECLVELTFFCNKRVPSVSTCRWRPNLWNLHLHLQELKMSELSLMIFVLSDRMRCKISFLSTIQILHLGVIADFMHVILSPCQRIDGVMIVLILFLTSLLLIHSLQWSAKCLANASAWE
jgi:hypothetical protein